MDVTGVGSRMGYAQLPTTQDMAQVLAARPSMAQMSSKAAAENATKQDELAASTAALASGSVTGKVDLYM